MLPIPVVSSSGDGKLKEIEGQLANINNALDPYSDLQNKVGTIPFFHTGARALLRIGGKPMGVAQSISWNITVNAEPIHTIDSPHAWDIDLGLVKITATISDMINPVKGPEANHLFNIMPAIVHQPMVEMQVIDKGTGTSLFFARGMFTSISGNISRGQVANFSANFTGVAFQHYVVQNFSNPYGGVGALGELANDVLGTVGNLLGGL